MATGVPNNAFQISISAVFGQDLRVVAKKTCCCGQKQSPFVIFALGAKKHSTRASKRTGVSAAWKPDPFEVVVDADNLAAVALALQVRDQGSNKLIGAAGQPLHDVPLRVDHPVEVALEDADGRPAGILGLVVHVMPPKMPKMLDGKFECTKLLGAGNFGFAVLAHSVIDDQTYAIKLIKCKEDSELETIKREAQLLFPMSSPHIVRYFSAFLHTDFDGDRNFAMVMEYCPDGTLLDTMLERRKLGKPFNQGQVGIWLYEMASALAYMHGNGIQHRDLKGDNVFMLGRHTKLADFGLASANTVTGGRAGALPYESPEQAQGQPYDGRNDVWALGCVATELLTLRMLTERVASNAVFGLDFPAVRSALGECHTASAVFGPIVARMLNFNPADRPTAEQVVAELAPLLPTFQAQVGASAAAGSASRRTVATELEAAAPGESSSAPYRAAVPPHAYAQGYVGAPGGHHGAPPPGRW